MFLYNVDAPYPCMAMNTLRVVKAGVCRQLCPYCVSLIDFQHYSTCSIVLNYTSGLCVIKYSAYISQV